MIEVSVSEDFPSDSLLVWITQKQPGGERLVLHQSTSMAQSWDGGEPGTYLEPSFSLPMDTGRALLEALMRHYQGAQDLHTVRADYLHERNRVDGLIATVTELAKRSP